jgi:twitching motility protein PilT
MAIKQMKTFEIILQEGFDKKASDIFLMPGEPACFRVRGELVRGEGESLYADQIKAIAEAAIGDERLRKDIAAIGRSVTSCGIDGVGDGRMCVASSFGDYTIVVRLLPRRLPDIKATRVPEAVIDASGASPGLVIFAGPVGSGKTTTMLAVLEHLNESKPIHICTVEDPISYRMESKKAVVQQHEVGVDVPNVVAGIAAAMRQDMDVLMVGEMKRAEEVEATLTAAQTGHLVMTQVHANSPEGAVLRLMSVIPGEAGSALRRQLAETLVCVCQQVLLPTEGGKGRVAAYGVLVVDDEMRRAIAAGEDLRLRTKPLPAGCQALSADAERLWVEGLISKEAMMALSGAEPRLESVAERQRRMSSRVSLSNEDARKGKKDKK